MRGPVALLWPSVFDIAPSNESIKRIAARPPWREAKSHLPPVAHRSLSKAAPVAPTAPVCHNVCKRGREGRNMVRLLLVCLLFSLAVSPIAAQDYPTRTITFICPFPAGGGSDVFARMLAQE